MNETHQPTWWMSMRENALLLEILGLAVVGALAGLLFGAVEGSSQNAAPSAVMGALGLPLLAKMAPSTWKSSYFEGLFKLAAILGTFGLIPLVILIDDLVLKHFVAPLYRGERPLHLTFLKLDTPQISQDDPEIATIPAPTVLTAAPAEATDRKRSTTDDSRLHALLQQLKSADWKTAKAAAIDLGELGDARAVEPLIGCLSHNNPDVRWGAATALAKLGDQLKGTEQAVSATGKLLELLVDSHWQLRASAADALGVFGTTQALDPLINALNDPEEHVVTSAAEALGQLGDRRAIPPLIACLKRGHWAVRAFADKSLTALTGQEFYEDVDKWERWYAGEAAKQRNVSGPIVDAGPDTRALWQGDKAARLAMARQLVEDGGEGAAAGNILLALQGKWEEQDSARQALKGVDATAVRPLAQAIVTPGLSAQAAGLSHLFAPHFKDIRFEVEKEIVRQPKNADAWMGLGDLYFTHSHFRPALACYEVARELGSTSEHLTSILEQLGLSAYAPKLRNMELLRLRLASAQSARLKLDALQDFAQ